MAVVGTAADRFDHLVHRMEQRAMTIADAPDAKTVDNLTF
jgi:hypothetical protein